MTISFTLNNSIIFSQTRQNEPWNPCMGPHKRQTEQAGHDFSGDVYLCVYFCLSVF